MCLGPHRPSSAHLGVLLIIVNYKSSLEPSTAGHVYIYPLGVRNIAGRYCSALFIATMAILKKQIDLRRTSADTYVASWHNDWTVGYSS